ncbi:DUF4179 domain-containing protein [uncultured Allofournierella sp.]|uniref:DUF4179 domain-containing protein n=1 Tax=uncultured Allofournierella sp. TaxID=1940258 RepID=UPI0037504ED1
MNAAKFFEAMNEVHDDYYQEASKHLEKNHRWTKWAAMAACLLFVLTMSAPVWAAAAFDPTYNLLYRVAPAIAQKLRPVRMSCNDKGIKFEVISAYVEGSEAKIFVSVQDFEEDRIDETIDLFDSYSINTPFDCNSSCEAIGYDAKTKTATFLISISQWDSQDIIGEKITFSVVEILSNKRQYDAALPDLDTSKISDAETMIPTGIFGGAGVNYREVRDNFRALKTTGVLCSPIDGVDIMGIGYVDGKLHIQVKYEKPGSQGYIYLKNNQGEEIHCIANVGFSTDNAHQDRYEEYVFNLSDVDLQECEVYGWFVTYSSRITGNWSLTFPLEGITR